MRAALLFAIVHIAVVVSCAQVDTSRTAVVDTLAVVNQNNLYSQELPKDIGPLKDSVRVVAAALPGRLRRRLRQEEQYKGWEEAKFIWTGLTHFIRFILQTALAFGSMFLTIRVTR